MDDEDEVNYAEMEPEYDMEFAHYGQNTIEMPMSPPRTPPLDRQPPFQREVSPFSEASSMTSVHSTDSVGMSAHLPLPAFSNKLYQRSRELTSSFR